ncbi:hypothetical protein EV193_103266 [Herbihabitans rhizosphaerae]|uniref:Calcineurin-like phosphoesterase domain-containing protein n=1 Tax=Herbihabitans rhizosphaerae TaxID=1872711 RepID=A0A4Q7KVA8_9PSEU|nr:metallophosphoesterase [Herbihabitans rhizosphaerae]RZS40948.1 hypothetical protein EV193_103266 [Herbihabitans rhizosphaerae]
MFFVGVTLAAWVGHFYLWRRLVRDTTTSKTLRKIGAGVLIALALLSAAGLLLPRRLGPDAGKWVAWPGYVWLALLVYLCLVLAVLELPRLALRRWVRGGPRTLVADATSTVDTPAEPEPVPHKESTEQSRRLFLARGSALVAGAASAGIVGYGMAEALGPPDVRRVTVPLRRLHPDLRGFRIAVVSDIHLGPMLGRGHTERVVRMINETGADLVAVVGDTVDGTVDELRRDVEPLRDLVSRHGSFFVTGNHEYYSGHEHWIAEFERLGMHGLRNEHTTISRGGGSFELAGINDVNGRSADDPPDIDDALAGRDTSVPTILLAHQPVQVSDAVRHKVDLQLSGHTHGGQFYPFHHVVQLGQPSLAGLSKVDDTWLYVTRGAGFWGLPVRVAAPPDITVVELNPEGA